MRLLFHIDTVILNLDLDLFSGGTTEGEQILFMSDRLIWMHVLVAMTGVVVFLRESSGIV